MRRGLRVGAILSAVALCVAGTVWACRPDRHDDPVTPTASASASSAFAETVPVPLTTDGAAH